MSGGPVWRKRAATAFRIVAGWHRQRHEPIGAITLEATRRCASRCLACSIWKDRSCADFDPAWLPRLLARRVDDDVQITLTGGEPFLHPRLLELLAGIWRLRPAATIGIASNGQHPERILAFLARLPAIRPTGGRKCPVAALDGGAKRQFRTLQRGCPPERQTARIGIGFSIDGLASTHDRLRGRPGNFAQITDLVPAVMRHGIPVELSMTLSVENWREFPAVADLARALGCGFSFRIAHSSRHYYQNEADPPARLSDDDARRLRAMIRDWSRHQPSPSWWSVFSGARRFVWRMTDATGAPRRARCFSGLHSVFVRADGDVYPCIALARPLGSLADRDLDAMLAGEATAAVLAHIARRRCTCWLNCETIASLGRSPLQPFWSLAWRLLIGAPVSPTPAPDRRDPTSSDLPGTPHASPP